MSLTLGWPADNSAARANSARGNHLRIRDLAHVIEAAEQPHRQQSRQPAVSGALKQSYELSLRNIDDNIYAMASATAALDRVEATLLQARAQLEKLCADGRPVDVGKVERTLTTLAEHINTYVRKADDNYVNLLRDTRLQLTISESGERDARTMKVDLTLISLDKLIAWKLREGPHEPEDWIDLIEAMSKVAMQNVQILSSLILTLFAARDYTTGVVQLVAAHAQDGIRIAGTQQTAGTDFVQAARAALLRDDSHVPVPNALPGKRQAEIIRAAPPSRLMAFLNQMTFQS